MALLSALLLSGCSLFGDRSSYEHPDYRVVERLGDEVEIRRYAPQLAAETTVTPDESDAAFRRLFDYISGNNSGGGEIAMTVPVETARAGDEIAMTVPVERADAAEGERMRFFLPSGKTLDTAPRPLDPRVRLVAVPEKTEAVLRFGGFGGDAKVARKQRELLQAVERSGWRAEGEPVAYFYDPPWTLPFFRRNEVAVTVEPLD